MLPRIGVISNPRSRQNRLSPRLTGRLAETLGSHGEVALPPDLPALLEVARRFRDTGVDIVGINGGDGTSHTVLTALKTAYGDAPLPRIALLRGGTMNTIPGGVGIRGSPLKVLKRLVARLDRGEAIPEVQRSLLRVDGETPQYGFLFGNGLISNYLELYYEGSEPTPVKAIWVLARGVFSSMVGGAYFQRLTGTVDLEVEVDGKPWPWSRYVTVAAGTVDDIGFGFRPFANAPSNPGHMHALGFACSPLQVVRELPQIRLGAPPRSSDIGNVLATRMTLKANRPISYMIDGDFHMGDRSLEVTVAPPVKILIP